MAELPLNLAIPRFKANEDRMDRFMNGTALQTWLTSDGTTVPTIRKFLADKNAEINIATDGILAASITAKNGAENARDTAVAARTDAIEAKNNAADSAEEAAESAAQAAGAVSNKLDKSDGIAIGSLAIHRQSDDTAGALLAAGKGRTDSMPLNGDTIAQFASRSARPDGVFFTSAVITITATENHTATGLGSRVSFGHVPAGGTARRDDLLLDDEGVKGRAKGVYEHLVVTPFGHGAGIASSAATNDAAFATMIAKLGNRKIDLMGESWPVSVVPTDKAVNGFWRIANFDANATIDLPAGGTMDWYECQLDGGSKSISWPQDTFSSYNGVPLLGYMAATGHDPGTFDWTVATSKNQCKDFTRFETGTSFDYAGADKVEVWAAAIIPPSQTLSPYPGAWHAAIAQNGALLNMYTKALAKYDESGASGGTVVNEGGWARTLFSGATLGQALRTAMDAAYGITTTGLPTLCHSLSLYGANKGDGGALLFGFHGLSPASGPHIGYVSNDPRDNASAIGFVARIGLLNEGVEPTVCWSHVGGSTRLCGFIRTQGSGYPIRFWEAAGINRAAIEAADIYGHPAGGNFGTLSPVPCRMRPRRKGETSGFIATSETLDGTDSDELHFAFTGRRTRADNKPGKVGLYWGRVARSGGAFGNVWSRAKIVKIADLYFARGNATANSNQVGVSSMVFSDPNTLHIAASTESPGIKADYDGQATLKVITIKLHDDYADAADRELYDTGLTRPTMVQRTPEYTAY